MYLVAGLYPDPLASCSATPDSLAIIRGGKGLRIWREGREKGEKKEERRGEGVRK